MVEDFADDAWVPGGPSLYSAFVAARLGAQVTLLTGLTDTYDRSALAGLTVIGIPARSLPRYENRYNAAGERTQILRELGQPLPARIIRETAQRLMPDVILLAPAYHEIESLPDITSASDVVGVSLQGAFRAVVDFHVYPDRSPGPRIRRHLLPGCWAFFSVEDAGDAEDACHAAELITGAGASVCVTDGERGVTIVHGSAGGQTRTHFDAIPATSVVDPTGAGDTFAASFLIRLAECGDELTALRFALAASSLAVEGMGIQAIPTRAAIESRVQMAGAV